MGRGDDTPLTIMVVDDTADLRELMVVQLRLLGYEVVEASNGREAVEVAKESCPALILMDIQMPVMDGLAATRLLRDIKALSRVAIVAFSAFSSGDNRRRALDAGCDDYLVKSAGITLLSNIVQRFLPAAS